MDAKADLVGALNYLQKPLSSKGMLSCRKHWIPTMASSNALNSIGRILMITGKPLSALMHAKEAYRFNEHIGDIYGQASSLNLQARCYLVLANYQHAQ
jgi:hypothetical protein